MSANVKSFAFPRPEALVDLERYPITDLASPTGRELVNDCRARLRATAAAALPGFLTPEAAPILAAEAAALAPHAYHRRREIFSYSEPPEDPSLPDDHVRRHKVTSSMGFVGYDMVPFEAGLRRLYEWDVLTHFVAAMLGEETLYRYGDPIAALTVSLMKEGDHQGWHFDLNDFIVSLMLQVPEGGGDFEYVPMIRTPGDENYPAIERVFSGSREGVTRISLDVGTWVLFQGRHSLHRVTPVHGRRRRLIVLFAYDRRRGATESDYSLREVYGRSRAVEVCVERAAREEAPGRRRSGGPSLATPPRESVRSPGVRASPAQGSRTEGPGEQDHVRIEGRKQ